MHRRLPLLLVVFAFACASGDGAPEGVARPTARFAIVGPVYFGSGSSAPITLAVEVTNQASVAVRLEEIELSSPDMSTWGIRTVRQTYDLMIPAGDKAIVNLQTTAVTSIRDPGEPLSLRAFIGLEVDGKRFRTMVRQ